MCTSFCICPGLPTDEHYQAYEAIEESVYNQYNRTFLGFDGAVNVDRDSADNEPLFWAFDPATGEANNYADIASNTLMECMDKVSETTAFLKQQMIADVEAEGASATETREAIADLDSALDGIGAQVTENRPEENIVNAVTFLETTYSCSGFCDAPLFYLTQDITNGPPTRGCVVPLTEGIGALFTQLGITMTITGVFFLLMIFFIFPMCLSLIHI